MGRKHRQYLYYHHPLYHRPEIKIEKISPFAVDSEGVPLRLLGYLFCVNVGGEAHGNFETLGAAKRFLSRLS